MSRHGTQLPPGSDPIGSRLYEDRVTLCGGTLDNAQEFLESVPSLNTDAALGGVNEERTILMLRASAKRWMAACWFSIKYC
jgi:hypothetical protein